VWAVGLGVMSSTAIGSSKVPCYLVLRYFGTLISRYEDSVVRREEGE
jgi:hypothetical protein